MGLIGEVLPIATIGAGAGALVPGSIAAHDIVLAGPDAVYIGTDDQSTFLVARLTGAPDPAPPQPRYTTTERWGQFSTTTWAGHDPYQMALPIKLDRGGRRTVEPDIRALWRLLGGGKATRPVEPPVVRLVGPVPHAGLRWRCRAFEVNDERTQYLVGTSERSRFAGTLTLVQAVADEKLEASLGPGKGVKARFTRARRGEDLYDISKRMYGNRSHAADIARANHVGVSFVPSTGLRLRIP